VLTISVASFRLLLDREAGLDTAILSSMRAVAANPGPMALWRLIVAAGLAIGSLPFLLGLICNAGARPRHLAPLPAVVLR
jgi:uncharacterized membrane protein